MISCTPPAAEDTTRRIGLAGITLCANAVVRIAGTASAAAVTNVNARTAIRCTTPSLDQQFDHPIEPLGAPGSAISATAAPLRCTAAGFLFRLGGCARRADVVVFGPITFFKAEFEEEDMMDPILFFAATSPRACSRAPRLRRAPSLIPRSRSRSSCRPRPAGGSPTSCAQKLGEGRPWVVGIHPAGAAGTITPSSSPSRVRRLRVLSGFTERGIDPAAPREASLRRCRGFQPGDPGCALAQYPGRASLGSSMPRPMQVDLSVPGNGSSGHIVGEQLDSLRHRHGAICLISGAAPRCRIWWPATSP